MITQNSLPQYDLAAERLLSHYNGDLRDLIDIWIDANPIETVNVDHIAQAVSWATKVMSEDDVSTPISLPSDGKVFPLRELRNELARRLS